MSSTDDMQLKVRLIIESAISELKLIGMEHDDAAALLAIQGFVRIQSDDQLDDVFATLLSLRDTSVGDERERLQ